MPAVPVIKTGLPEVFPLGVEVGAVVETEAGLLGAENPPLASPAARSCNEVESAEEAVFAPELLPGATELAGETSPCAPSEGDPLSYNAVRQRDRAPVIESQDASR